ncbi:hypothetical protein FHL15_007098 [Xylaria flabelliformis]|uniref:Uncharacterized protein n=1 Tax=Xylaria flabelliformis TaxID=2512241 RepID=A0A553HVL7_9PEZI|nr:hypothetical protein FHL15_007098 [Xylaria flabelliformis]
MAENVDTKTYKIEVNWRSASDWIPESLREENDSRLCYVHFKTKIIYLSLVYNDWTTQQKNHRTCVSYLTLDVLKSESFDLIPVGYHASLRLTSNLYMLTDVGPAWMFFGINLLILEDHGGLYERVGVTKFSLRGDANVSVVFTDAAGVNFFVIPLTLHLGRNLPGPNCTINNTMTTQDHRSSQASDAEQLTDGPTTEREVSLPPNVSIYTGPSSAGLLRASIFTRLVTTVQDPAELAAALGSDCATFCHQHQNVVLIFDEDLNPHHEHFREVCLRLKDNGDLGLDYGRCIFDVGSSLHAGFQMDKLQGGAVMVVDLQDRDDDDREDDSDAEDDASLLASLGEPDVSNDDLLLRTAMIDFLSLDDFKVSEFAGIIRASAPMQISSNVYGYETGLALRYIPSREEKTVDMIPLVT